MAGNGNGNGGSSRPLRGAIIGFGNVAVHAHLPVWERDGRFSIEAVMETDPRRAEMAKELLPHAHVYSRMEDLLAEGGLDFVDVCTPPCYHTDAVIAACASGLHVFCEKPLATSVESLRRIGEAAQRADRVVFTVNNWKYAPIWLKAAEIIRENRIGAVRSFSLTVLRRPGSGGGASDWRRSAEIAQGGILIDHGWHNLYLMLSLMKEPPISIAARMEPKSGNGSGLEETVDLDMRFPGAEGRLHLTWQASCRRNFGVMIGDGGTLAINDDHLILQSGESPAARYDFQEPLSAGSHHPEWMEPVVENFEREISDPSRRGANLREARWCARLIELAYHSHREASGPVQIDFPAPQGDRRDGTR